MKRYLRPLGFLSGPAAAAAIEKGRALPLAGGPLAFSLVEIIERADARTHRSIVAAPDLADELVRHTARRSFPFPLTREGTADVPLVMGIVNVTPDSFSDGGRHFDPARAVAHAASLIEVGAHIVDIGGESTRPGATPVDPAEESRRIVPVILGIRDAAAASGTIISVDTRNGGTMRAALDAGAGMINDISALSHDPESLAVAAATAVPVALMHMRGDPPTMQLAPAYEDVALDVYDHLEGRIAACLKAGIGLKRIAIDPGIGFGKNVAHNLALLDQLAMFHGLAAPLLVGVSRKGFIARLSAGEPPERRLGGSLAAALAALGQGAQIVRAHDVAETAQAVRIVQALRQADG